MKKLFNTQVKNLVSTLVLYVGLELPQAAWLDSETNRELGAIFSPELFQDAVKYEGYLSGRMLALGDEACENGAKAIGAYQARYVAVHLSRRKVKNILRRFGFISDKEVEPSVESVRAHQKRLREHAEDLYAALAEALGEPDFKEKFTHLESVKVSVEMLDNFPDLVRYPARLTFTDDAIKIMNQRVIDSMVTPRIADYYIYSFESYEEIVALLPVMEFLVRETNYAHLIWLAGDYLNIIWRVLPDDEILNARFERVLFNAYWLKINSIWPIVNYPKIKFREENDQIIFDDALGWVTSLKTIDELCPELCEYLDFLGSFSVADQIESGIPEPIIKRAFHRKHKDATPEEFFAATLNELPEEDALTTLAHPETRKEAELSLDFLMGGELDVENIPFFAEKLVNVSHPAEIGAYIIDRYASDLDKLAKQFTDFDPTEAKSHYITISIFETACDNATGAEELAALERLAEAIRGLEFSKSARPGLEKKLERALGIARANVADFQKAREKLVRFLAY